ncbi:MAG: T9SS type A sorting domain-containing protein [Ignavibacteria bacterium]|nr:T9SS type A sorting domain-containing protein [Ignavibacteria bacterium]
MNANQLYYTDFSVTIGNNYEYRVRAALAMPDFSHYIYTGYAQSPIVGFVEDAWISGPSSVTAYQYHTWTGNPSGGQYEWRYKYINQQNWSNVIGTSNQLTFKPSQNFSLQLKVTFGVVSQYEEKPVTVIFEAEDDDRIESFLSEVPNEYQLYQNFPNPFNPSTKIQFYLPEDNYVRIKLFDLLGREISIITDGVLDQGFHSVEFSSENLSSGVYLYKMEAGNKIFTRKMIVNK